MNRSLKQGLFIE